MPRKTQPAEACQRPVGGRLMHETAEQGNTDEACPQITLITKRDVPPLMSKRISLYADGKLKSDGSECRMVTGTAERTSAETAGDLACIIGNCRSDQTIALGALKEELAASVAVTIPKRLDKH